VLTTTKHDRDSAGLTYVYPVISRRSGGLSIGVNLNPNNACNWRCVYCQVPDLKRGSAPATDLILLEQELRGFLETVLQGDFYQRFEVPLEQRVIRDIALSGNGEPTSSPQFDRVIELIGLVYGNYGLGRDPEPNIQKESNFQCQGKAKLVLITNGSLVRREIVQKGLKRWAELGGEAWFKLDNATQEGIFRINGVHLSPETVLHNLEATAIACPVWLQTCLFSIDGLPPSPSERKTYLAFLRKVVSLEIPVRGVLLYGLARPSMQPEASHLTSLSAEWMDNFAKEVRATGLETKLSL